MKGVSDHLATHSLIREIFIEQLLYSKHWFKCQGYSCEKKDLHPCLHEADILAGDRQQMCYMSVYIACVCVCACALSHVLLFATP